MKRILLNPINIITLVMITVIVIFANYKVNIQPNIKINNIYKELCLNKENMIYEHDLGKCELLGKNEKAVKLNFEYVYHNLQYEGLLLFFTLLIIILIVSTIRFHRIVHSGFVKLILTRRKYRDFIIEESLIALLTGVFIYTMYFLITLTVAYFSSEVLGIINYSRIFFEYFNTLLYFIYSILLSIILLMRITNFILYVLMSYLSVLSLQLILILVNTILKIFSRYNNQLIFKLIDSFFLPFEYDVNFFFIPQILLNILLFYTLIRTYKNKEAFIIEIEK